MGSGVSAIGSAWCLVVSPVVTLARIDHRCLDQLILIYAFLGNNTFHSTPAARVHSVRLSEGWNSLSLLLLESHVTQDLETDSSLLGA